MRIGIIGGGYFWRLWGKEHQTIYPNTPFGCPADKICFGSYNNHQIFTLQRHGFRHEYYPTVVPWLANVYAMYLQNLDFIIQVSTCGALNKDYMPGDIVLFDQILDFTKNRPTTFGSSLLGSIIHVDMSHPISSELISFAQNIFKKNKLRFHTQGTMVVEEGPRFATNAETMMYRQLGGSLVNQSSAPEIFLCKELSLPVLGLTLVTNIVDTKSTGFTGYDDIAENINRFKNVVPKALSIFFDNLTTIDLTKSHVRPFDVSKLDLRPI